jgi:hypothetical protein
VAIAAVAKVFAKPALTEFYIRAGLEIVQIEPAVEKLVSQLNGKQSKCGVQRCVKPSVAMALNARS